MPVDVYGVRHHGPGSARAVRAALEEQPPDLVLIEGCPELDAIVDLLGETDMVPPVAGLVYAVDEPRQATFYPLAHFSPEWVAARWALAHGTPVRFLDLPATHAFALAQEAAAASEPADDGDADGDPVQEPPVPSERLDPIGTLAATAGYDDAERWWEDVIEGRRDGDPFGTFDAVTEAMTAVRADRPETDEQTLRREAHMRRTLRAVLKSGARRVAVVCGAWHAPALAGTLPGRPATATADNALLRKLPTAKVTLTWVPWTHSRLAAASGYGAGIDSPGWYRHLFTAVEHPLERWLTHTAGVLRAHDLPTSTAHVIESVRLARTLAHLRDRPEPGLTEVIDATRAVLCDGNELAVGLVLRDAVAGEELGRVPDSAPMVPL
jgi:hypothetical protein